MQSKSFWPYSVGHIILLGSPLKSIKNNLKSVVALSSFFKKKNLFLITLFSLDVPSGFYFKNAFTLCLYSLLSKMIFFFFCFSKNLSSPFQSLILERPFCWKTVKATVCQPDLVLAKRVSSCISLPNVSFSFKFLNEIKLKPES